MRPVRMQWRAGLCRAGSLAALLTVVASGSPARALDIAIDSYLPDFSLKVGGNVQYMLGVRTESPDAAIYRNPAYTEADYEFSKGSLNVARIDLSGSAELAYQDWLGLRVGATAWMDNAFSNTQKAVPDDTPPYTAPSYLALFDYQFPPTRTSFQYPYSNFPIYTNGSGYNSYVQRWQGGPSAELRDLFFWGNFALWQVPFNVKLGQYNTYWGESIFDTVDGISYAQNPIDLERGLREPALEARDLVLPLPQIGITAQPTTTFSFGLQYLFGWEASRVPPAGTYFGNPYAIAGSDAQLFTDVAYPTDFNGTAYPVEVPYLGYDKPRNAGSFGLYLKFKPEWMWGWTSSLYYRRADETLPWVLESPVTAVLPKGSFVCTTSAKDAFPLCAGLTAKQAFAGYNAVYNKGVQLIGLGLEKNWFGMTFGSEFVMRRGTALQTIVAPSPSVAGFGPDTTPTSPPPDLVQGEGARGNTMHALLNVMGALQPTRYWDTLDWKLELAYAHLSSISQNSFLYAGEGYGGCMIGPLSGNPAGFRTPAGTDAPGSKADGCASSSAASAHVSVAPTWYDVWPALSLGLPISFGEGLMGNSPVLGGSRAGTGAYSVGLAADYRRRFNLTLAYNDYLSRYREVNGIAMDNNLNALGTGLYNDRGWVSMTFKMPF